MAADPAESRGKALLIAGAGIGGLTAALALARAGHDVTIVERSAELAEVGAGIQLTPNASRILAELGLGPALAPHVTAPDALVIHSQRSGGEIARLTLGATVAGRYGAPWWVIHRADLQAVLAEAARAHPRIALRLGSTLESVEAGATGVTATIDTATGRLAVHADGLIGADGVRSVTRLRVLRGPPAAYTGRIAYRATIAIDETPEAYRRVSGLWMGEKAHLVHYPVRAGRELNLVAVVEAPWRDETWSAEAPRDEVIGAFDSLGAAPWPDAALALIGAPKTWTKWALCGVEPNFAWSNGAVTVLGDAAHAMLPFAAQGGAMAIEDADGLARALSRPLSVADAFKAYERARKPRDIQVVDLARSNGQIYHMSGLIAAARDASIRLMGDKRLLARLDWLYGWRLDGGRT